LCKIEGGPGGRFFLEYDQVLPACRERICAAIALAGIHPTYSRSIMIDEAGTIQAAVFRNTLNPSSLHTLKK